MTTELGKAMAKAVIALDKAKIDFIGIVEANDTDLTQHEVFEEFGEIVIEFDTNELALVLHTGVGPITTYVVCDNQRFKLIRL